MKVDIQWYSEDINLRKYTVIRSRNARCHGGDGNEGGSRSGNGRKNADDGQDVQRKDVSRSMLVPLWNGLC